MRAVLSDDSGLLGAIHVVDGKAVPSNDAVKELMDGLYVTEPDNPDNELTPDDGELYILGLGPLLSRSSYLVLSIEHP